MSGFSDVDNAIDPSTLVRSLAESSRGLTAMKHYVAATFASLVPRGDVVLDLGCGAGHDLAVLDRLGVGAVGVDPSDVMLSAGRARTDAPLARALGERLPFRDHAYGGCWIERVLMHVDEPSAVIAEVVRCLRPSAVLAVFEPDWSSLTVNGWRVPVAWSTAARHPGIGSEVGARLEDAGCLVRDRVEERSWWTYEQFDGITARAAAPARHRCPRRSVARLDPRQPRRRDVRGRADQGPLGGDDAGSTVTAPVRR